MLRIFTLILISFTISINGTLINGTRSGSRSYNSRDNDPYLAFKKKKNFKKKHKVKKNKILNIESYKKHAICLSWGGICLNTLVNAFKIREGRHCKSLLYFLRTSVGYKYQINEKWAIVGKVTVFGDRGHVERFFAPPCENLFIFNFGGGIERYYHKTSSGSIIGFSILVNLLYAGTYGDVCGYGYYGDFPLSTFWWTNWGLNVTIIPFLVKIQNWNIRIVTGCIDLKFLCGAIDDAINNRNDNFKCLISCLWRNIGIEIGREWSFG